MKDSSWPHVRSFAEAAKERRRFLSSWDHELLNPLTAILAALANLRSVYPSTEQEGTIESIEAQMSRMRTLGGDLRKLADLETHAIDLAPVDIARVLQDSQG